MGFGSLHFTNAVRCAGYAIFGIDEPVGFYGVGNSLKPVAFSQGRLMGCARLWRVRIGGMPVTFLGPFAVEQGERSAGFGARMIERACEAARAAGETHVVLVGDEPYFSRVGFSGALARGVLMPAPVDQRRVLVRDLTGADAPLSGAVTPA